MLRGFTTNRSERVKRAGKALGGYFGFFFSVAVHAGADLSNFNESYPVSHFINHSDHCGSNIFPKRIKLDVACVQSTVIPF